MTATEAHAQVVAMLEAALVLARRENAIGCELHIVHGNTTSSYRYFNAEALQEAQTLLEAPQAGGVQ